VQTVVWAMVPVRLAENLQMVSLHFHPPLTTVDRDVHMGLTAGDSDLQISRHGKVFQERSCKVTLESYE
jgi:hypothetical protein